MDLFVFTGPRAASASFVADVFGDRLAAQGRTVRRMERLSEIAAASDEEVFVISETFEALLGQLEESEPRPMRAFFVFDDAPDQLMALPKAAAALRDARGRGLRFAVDHWVLNSAAGEKTVWEFDHHCAPCRVDWTIPRGSDGVAFADTVIRKLGLERKVALSEVPMPSKVALPGDRPSAQFTYVFDANDLGPVGGEPVPPPPTVSLPAKPRRAPGLIYAAVGFFAVLFAGALFVL